MHIFLFSQSNIFTKQRDLHESIIFHLGNTFCNCFLQESLWNNIKRMKNLPAGGNRAFVTLLGLDVPALLLSSTENHFN